MSDIDQMKLRRLDLTVLLVFLGLMRHRKAVAVAAEMGLTQSSVSHALRRLRDIFGDELFLRRPFGLEPTAVAEALEPQVRLAVEGLNAALAPPQPFDPAGETGILRIAALDYHQAVVLPPLLARLADLAPGLRVQATAVARQAALAALDAAEIDLALGFFWETDARTLSTELYRDGYCVAARADHPALHGPMTMDRYLAARHLLVSPGGGMEGIVDSTLAQQGLTRRVHVGVSQFFPALALLAGSDFVATLPRRLAERFRDAFGLGLAPVPFDLRPYRVSLLRHKRDDRNPRLDWIAAQLALVSG